eukprot:scaffold67026_cov28-Tisochrysis_lutea.AAC.2
MGRVATVCLSAGSCRKGIWALLGQQHPQGGVRTSREALRLLAMRAQMHAETSSLDGTLNSKASHRYVQT